MKKTGTKHPVIFNIVLFIVTLLFAAVMIAFLDIAGMDHTMSSAVSRIAVGLLMLLVFLPKFELGKSFKGIVLVLPALILALYKIPLHFITGGGEPAQVTLLYILMSLAPAVYEEVLFRGILIHDLKQKHSSPTVIVLISAVVFSVVHITNMGGMHIISLMLQLILALAVGTIFGAIYLQTGDLLSLIAAHFLIDFFGNIFPGGEGSIGLIAAVIVLFLAAFIYGLYLMRRIPKEVQE